jgi:hypothetical protein
VRYITNPPDRAVLDEQAFLSCLGIEHVESDWGVDAPSDAERSVALPTDAADVVSQNEVTGDTRAEEARQVRAALAEYFSILEEWTLHGRRTEAGFDSTEDHL